MTNYANLEFSDEKTIILYLYGIIEDCRTLKSIHRYAKKHLMEWFPKLPGYGAFNQRINHPHDVFAPQTNLISTELSSGCPH
jgi:hypothetical protein